MAYSAGTKLGPYEIVAPIGAGGMGEVYRAHDSRLQRDVAIKVSAQQFSHRFEREARAIAALNHSNICQVYDIGPNYLGNYGGQTIQKGHWRALVDFLSSLCADHVVLEMAHRPAEDLEAIKEVDARIRIGIGVVDVKINHVETPDEIARRIGRAEGVLGPDRLGWVHPDCGFWMLKRSVADRKIEALVKGRDLYLGS